MKSIFICKPATLEEVRTELERIATGEREGTPETYKVIATKKVSETEWNDLTNNLLSDRAWLSAFNRKLETKANLDWSRRNCIKVSCEGKAESLLIDTQGYDYARYVAILEN